jgi:hypothetical protein
MVDSDIARAQRTKHRKQQPPQNININPRDYQALQLNGQPGNVGTNNGLLGLLNQQGSGTGSNSFHPLNSIQDFISGVRNPVVPGVSSQEYLDRSQSVPQVPGSDPMEEIMAQIQKLISGEGQNLQFQPMQMPTFDPNRYKDEAENAVNAQFNPILNQIRQQQVQTQTRARQNRASLQQLYTGAANDLNAEAKTTQAGYDQAQAESQKLYTDERNRIAAGYAADAAMQRKEQQQLGTAALGDNGASQQQAADKQFADQMGSQQMQSSQNALSQQGLASADYDRSIAGATRQEGIDAQADIMSQLEDYLSTSNTNLANTQAQQAGSITDLMMRMAQAGYDRDAQNSQFQYQQQRDYIGDQSNLAKMQQEMLLAQLQGQQGAGSEKLNPWQDAAMFADQLQPGHGQDIVAAIQAAMANRGEIYARPKDDQTAPMNPALFAKLIADYPGNQGMDRNKLMQVAQVLYQQLYGT